MTVAVAPTATTDTSPEVSAYTFSLAGAVMVSTSPSSQARQAVGFGDGEVFNAFLGNGEVLRSAEFQRQRCALDDEIHLLGFGQNDLIAVGEREGYVFIVLYDAFEERVAVFSLIAVRTVLTDRFDRLSVFAFDGFRRRSPNSRPC